ncbi:MAG: SGNH/GDSL hydrolase family protein [Thermodesulfobacteriota bacterium]
MRRRAKKLLFALAPLAALLIVSEAACRLFLPVTEQNRPGSAFVTPDPDLVWKLAPCPGPRPCVNEIGLRDGPYRARADVKILLLGDSVAWGEGMPDMAQVFPQLWEKELGERFPGLTVEVVNASVPGYSTFQESAYLAIHGPAIAPDAVVLCFCLNDAVERYQTLAPWGGSEKFMGVDTRGAAKGVFGALLRNSRAFFALSALAQKAFRNREDLQVRKMAERDWPPALSRAWEFSLQELSRAREVAAGLGAPFFLVIAPYRFQLDDPAASRKPQDLLLAWADARRVPALDLLPAFARVSSLFPDKSLFLDENHFSPAGHRLAASLLSRFFEERVRNISQKKGLSLAPAVNDNRVYK